ncbi:hypothetical protein HAX54_032540, partial [Datura stramonium]|nr:hypothetical protein [Datura stramonium]
EKNHTTDATTQPMSCPSIQWLVTSLVTSFNILSVLRSSNNDSTGWVVTRHNDPLCPFIVTIDSTSKASGTSTKDTNNRSYHVTT